MQYYNLTIPQKNIWNLQTFYGDTAVANICGAVIFKDARDTDLLEKALNKVIKNQTALRLHFIERVGDVKQYVAEYTYVNIPVKQFKDESEFENYASKCAATPIGLSERNMYRFEIVCFCGKVGVLVALSHLISDAWTFSLLVKEMDKAYQGLIGNETGNEKAFDYITYAMTEKNYFHSEKYEKDAIYWDEKYHEKPEKCCMKPNASQAKKINANRVIKSLPAELSKQINEFCVKNQITPPVLFETALSIYLHKINVENHSITIGLPVLNRNKLSEKNTAGMFISTMPLTVAVSENDTVEQLAERITNTHTELFRHQKYPYSEILQNLREKHKLEGNLYDVMFSFQNAKTDVDADTRWFGNGYSEVPFTLHIDNRDNQAAYTLTADYQTELFRDTEVQDIISRLEFIIGQITGDISTTIRNIMIIPDEERNRILYDFNDTKVDYPRDKCVHELFMEQAEKTPDEVAVVFEDKKITYRELDEMSNALAHLLRDKGAGRGDIVPIIAKRSYYIIAAMLGILKAGAAYMPIAPDYPKDRVEFIISEAKSRIGCVLGYEEKLSGVELLKLDELGLEDAQTERRLSVDNRNTPDDLCYIIFTSGSTGVPKGVMIRHGNVTNYSNNNNNNVCHAVIQEGYRKIISVTNIIFDIFVTESILPLLNGMTVYFTSDEEVFSQSAVNRIVTENNIEVLQTTPTKMKGYLFDKSQKEYLSTLKVIILGGEALSTGLYEELRKQTTAEIFNIYGPAETTVWSSNARVENADITIGRPIANTQIYILDKHNRPVPIGVPGELCIAGDGVGKGYLNRPDLTAERFVPNPFATEENGHGKVMYHTGDLAAWRDNGEIEYLGRIDTQVKIRGLRIELGEIESVMSQFPGIRMCAVTDKKDEEGRQYLVGYYTTSSDGKENQDIMTAVHIDERTLREHLASKLPKYMVPNYFMHLSEIPMTPSGKTDRKNLPAPDKGIQSQEELKLPQNDMEERILSIWKEELHTEQLGCNQDFFEVGGDSLLAISLLTRIEQEFGVRLQMKDIFENRTVEEQAAGISKNRVEREALIIRRNDRFLLTSQQKAVYLASQKEPDSLIYNMPAFIKLPQKVDRDRLSKALQKVFEDFQILKMKVSQETEGIYGVIENDSKLEIESYTEEEKKSFVRPFDLHKAPLWRVGFSDSCLLIDMHHIISDGTSLQILIKAVQAIYEGREQIHEVAGYSDYADYQRQLLKQEKIEEGLQWYRKNLSTAQEMVVFPKTDSQALYGGENYICQLSSFSKSIIKELCGQYQITETMLHMAIYALLLKCYSGKMSVPGSVIVANRQHYETEHTLGMFVNTLPVAWDFEKEQTVMEYLQICKEKLLKLYEYEEIPFESVMECIGNQNAPIFNTSFTYQANSVLNLELEGQRIAPCLMDTHTSKFDLTVEVTPKEEGDMLRLEYRTDKISRQLAERMAGSYESILLQLSEKEMIDEISALTKEEESRILYDFNNTKVDYPRDKCVHELFMEQTKKTPDEVAVVFEDKKITYRELDEMSNALAHLLRDKGVDRGDVVPIIAKRSHYIIVAMLGILKTGASYMPIAPDYPKDRVEFIINEAKCSVGCTLGYDEKLTDIELLKLDELGLEDVQTERKLPVENRNTPDDLCYIIFTSGSTGVPKGVMIRHGNVTNYSHNNNNNNVCHVVIQERYRKIISVTNIVFDIFVTESILPLLNGMTVYFTSDEEVFSQSAINRIVTDNAVEVLQTTPTKMKGYLFDKSQKEYLSTLKVIILGGEALSTGLYEELRKQTTAEIFNIYGPAETTVWSSNARVENVDITIGRPIANTQIYILDKHSRPVPIGVPGELCIAGDGVGKGYLNRPDLTAERFVPNPFATEENGHGRVMYHTGDLAAWQDNGEIEYLGRIDTQVKIRGLRIELGEIESVMSQFPGIRMCAVTDQKDEEGRQYLVGYYTTASDGKENQNIMTAVYIDERALREHLASKLPKYMVPNYFMHLKEIPMTPSGKTDRKNLPVPQTSVADLVEYVAPVTEAEKNLCKIMEEVLDYRPIGLIHDFFAYGGDSLKAVEFAVRAEEAGFHIMPQDIFEHPTVSEMVHELQGRSIQADNDEYYFEIFDK